MRERGGGGLDKTAGLVSRSGVFALVAAEGGIAGCWQFRLPVGGYLGSADEVVSLEGGFF